MPTLVTKPTLPLCHANKLSTSQQRTLPAANKPLPATDSSIRANYHNNINWQIHELSRVAYKMDPPATPPEHQPREAVTKQKYTDRHRHSVIENCTKYEHYRTIKNHFLQHKWSLQDHHNCTNTRCIIKQSFQDNLAITFTNVVNN